MAAVEAAVAAKGRMEAGRGEGTALADHHPVMVLFLLGHTNKR